MAKTKQLRKRWHPILAPKLFNNVPLGETYVYEAQKMIGKTMKHNLMNLTRDVKRQNVTINFEVTNVSDGTGYADIVGYNIVPASMKRLVRRNVEKLELSFACTTADNKNIRIKPILITRTPTSGSVASKIRKSAQDYVMKYVNKTKYDALIHDMISKKLQDGMRKELHKVHPLKVCDIRALKLIKAETAQQAKKEEKKQEAAQTKKEGKEEMQEPGQKDATQEKPVKEKKESKEEKPEKAAPEEAEAKNTETQEKKE